VDGPSFFVVCQRFTDRTKPDRRQKRSSVHLSHSDTNLHGYGLSCVIVRHGCQAERFVVVGVAGLAELGHAQRHHFFHGFARGFQVAARIEFLGLLENTLRMRRDGQTLSVST